MIESGIGEVLPEQRDLELSTLPEAYAAAQNLGELKSPTQVTNSANCRLRKPTEAEPDFEKRPQRRGRFALPAELPNCGERSRRLATRVGVPTFEVTDSQIHVGGKSPYVVSMHG
jgi:hypothetical protein